MDAETVIERAAIMQYDGDMARWNAEKMAALEADAIRKKFSGLVSAELSRYRGYIERWRPSSFEEKPELPPNCKGNELCWEMFWGKTREVE